jgi:two-component system C4-dicarboxylate transport sensor histidine kinase DctB
MSIIHPRWIFPAAVPRHWALIDLKSKLSQQTFTAYVHVMRNLLKSLAMRTHREHRGLWLLWLGVATALVICVVSYWLVMAYLLKNAEQEAGQRARFFASSMDDALSRLEHLPYVLASDAMTLEALNDGDGSQINPLLAEVADRSQAELIYLLDINGQAIASSNFRDADNLIGNSYSFRPYFQDAITGQQGRFYAVGVTTGRPGYFIAEPVRGTDGEVHGVIAVKIGIADLSRELSQSGELVLVTNAQNVVLASSNSELIYGFLTTLSDLDRNTLEAQQQFGDELIFPLDWSASGRGKTHLNGSDYLQSQTKLTKENWHLHLLSDVADIRRQALFYITLGVLAALLLIVAAATYRAIQLRAALVISDTDRHRLSAEIEERKITETKLEAARTELERKKQLAVLGQLSASITHELGQPISAMRNYLVAEEIATGATPGSVWPEFTGLVDRMQRILDQLRPFGRTSILTPDVFNVQTAIVAAQQLIQHTADAANVHVTLELTQTPCELTGQAEQFEQVIVNLLRNGIDAAQDVEDGRVTLSLQNETQCIVLQVTDNGAGLGDLEISELREPFFSTKPSGKGMGLGLAISGQIVNEMGGTLQAANGFNRGAVFSVMFPKNARDDV